MCFLRLSLSFLMAIAFHISTSSPSTNDFQHDVLPREIPVIEVILRVLHCCKSVVKVIYWGLTVSEVLHIFSDSQPDCGSVSLAYWIGSALTAAGCLIRVVCYATLGHMFTFTLTFQPGHRLVTRGPYAFVRHPAYTGLVMCVAGIIVAQASPGSWLRQSGTLVTPLGAFAVLVWLWSMVTATTCHILRMKDEDALMREMFRDEWVGWAGQVKYRLVPGVY